MPYRVRMETSGRMRTTVARADTMTDARRLLASKRQSPDAIAGLKRYWIEAIDPGSITVFGEPGPDAAR